MAEIVFKGHEDGGGVPNMINNVFKKSPLDFQKELASNLLVSGGSTMSFMFDQRLQDELEILNT